MKLFARFLFLTLVPVTAFAQEAVSPLNLVAPDSRGAERKAAEILRPHPGDKPDLHNRITFTKLKLDRKQFFAERNGHWKTFYHCNGSPIPESQADHVLVSHIEFGESEPEQGTYLGQYYRKGRLQQSVNKYYTAVPVGDDGDFEVNYSYSPSSPGREKFIEYIALINETGEYAIVSKSVSRSVRCPDGSRADMVDVRSMRSS